MRAHTSGFALEFTLKTQNATEQRGHQHAHRYLGQLLGIVEVSELGHQCYPDLMPPGVHGVLRERTVSGWTANQATNTPTADRLTTATIPTLGSQQ
ncbi:hypothetical protein D3C78_1637910 [compost metagenome]